LRYDAQFPAMTKEPGLIGPPIVLTRGQPVEIEVVNRLKDPTAIHWHGIELESYFDGVPGWSGADTPSIAPGTSGPQDYCLALNASKSYSIAVLRKRLLN
jgi:FtsP/CotA-like multicopper oxidase with cupredoxin domain